jgi:glutamate synthase domain-containing protein 1
MCGIVGLYLKNPQLQPRLGALVEPMLGELSERGPDSAGFAVYRDPVPDGMLKLSLSHPSTAYDWSGFRARLERALAQAIELSPGETSAVVRLSGSVEVACTAVIRADPEVLVHGYGTRLEVYKRVGLPREVARHFGLAQMAGTHALGHTRLATESAVTTEHSHPFAAGVDLCLVHNGSLSNHNRLRERLMRQGINFTTDNDSEVASGYFALRLREGLSLSEAMTAGLSDLDGFFTFAVGTREGFAVIRDPIGCKPAVLAETDDWVAMASEYRAIANLPGADGARVWEPLPGEVYAWGRA